MKSNKPDIAESYQYLWTLLEQIANGESLSIDRINLSGSRKSAKTWSVIMFMILACLVKKVKVYGFRYMKGDSYELLKQFKDIISILGLSDKVTINQTRYTITFGNGSQIEIIGLHKQTNDEANVSGLSSASDYDYIISFAEERYQISNKDWSKVGQAIRGQSEVLEIHAANPWLTDNDYVQYCSAKLTFDLETLKAGGEQFYHDKENAEIFHYSNYMINEYLTEKEIKRLIRDANQDPHTINTVLYGMPGSLEGSIWKYVIEQMLRPLDPEDEAVEFVGCVDYGEKGDASTAYIIGYAPSYTHAHIEHEYYWANKPGMQYKKTDILADDTVMHFINFMEDNNLRQELYVYVDSAAVPFITALNNTAESYGYDDVLKFVQSKKYKVEERVEQIKMLASYGMITIDPECTQLIREYQSQTYSGKSTPYRLGDDHGTDAIEYGLANKWNELIDNLNTLKEL